MNTTSLLNDNFDNLYQSTVNEANNIIDDFKTLKNSLKSNSTVKTVEDANHIILENEDKIANITKILKRSLKGENNVNHIQTLERAIKSLNVSYNDIIEQIKVAEHSLPKQEIKQTLPPTRIKQVARVLHLLGELQDKVDKKLEILNYRASYPIPPLPRWDQIARQQVDSKEFQTLSVIIEKIGLKNHVIRLYDYQWLIKLRDDPSRLEALSLGRPQEFKAFISGIISQIEDSGLRKSELLKNLLKEMKANSSLAPEDQLKYKVQARQILHNPLEIPLDNELFDIDDMINQFKEKVPDWYEKIPYTKETFGYKLEGLKKIQDLAKKTQQGSLDDVLISGAGPGGLMLGLLTSLQGKKLTLVESRSQENAMTRNNILALGYMDHPSALKILDAQIPIGGAYFAPDLKLLDFFGVTDKLLGEGKVFALQPSDTIPFNVKINDLQKAMLEALQALEKQNAIVLYEKRIEQISSSGPDKPAQVKLSGEEKARAPSVVYAMEGYRSSTRTLLGIDVLKQSKAAVLGYSFFEEKPSRSLQDEFLAKLTKLGDAVQAVPTLLTLLAKTLSSNSADIQNYQSIFDILGRAEVLLRIPGSDYFYFTPSKKEAAHLKSIKTELAQAQKAKEKWWNAVEKLLKEEAEHFSKPQEDYKELIAALKGSRRKEWLNDPEKTQSIFDKLHHLAQGLSGSKLAPSSALSALLHELNLAVEEAARAKTEYEQGVEKVGKNISGPGRFYHSLFSSDQPDTPTYVESEVSASQVQKAEANYRQMGSTHFYVGGDAESATDPASGAGARTVLQRCLMAATAFADPQFRDNPFEQSVFAWATHLGGTSMREEGLDLRRTYMTGSERLERYLHIAEEAGVMTQEDFAFFLKLEGKMKNRREFPQKNIKLSDAELKHLERIRQKLFDAYNHTLTRKRVHFYHRNRLLDDQGQWNINIADLNLTPKEAEIYLQAWKMALKKDSGTDLYFDLPEFKNAAAKVAVYREGKLSTLPYREMYAPEAWFVVMSQLIANIKHELG